MKKDFGTFFYMICGLLVFSILNLSSITRDLTMSNDDLADFSKYPIIRDLSKFTDGIKLKFTDKKEILLQNPAPLYAKKEKVIKEKTEPIAEIVDKDEKIDPLEEAVQKPGLLTGFEAVKDIKMSPPLNFLIVGDSLVIQSFGVLTEQKLFSYEGVDVYREGHYSTGLNRIDYYDWYAKTQELIDSFEPDVLIIFIGSNDGQGIVAYDGAVHKWPSPGWDVAYRERIHKYMEDFSPQVSKLYWIGHPVPKTDNFNLKFTKMNEIYSSESLNFDNIVFINSWDRFTVNGVYSPTVADDSGLSQYVKSSDGVHLTPHGGKILTELLFTYMEKDIDFSRLSE